MGHQKVLELPCSEPKNQKLNEKTCSKEVQRCCDVLEFNFALTEG